MFFSTAGRHGVTASLPPDAVPADNRRSCIVHVVADYQVLAIDGDPQGNNFAYLQSVFQPGERVQTGIRPVRQPETYLRDIDPSRLAAYPVVYLLDVPRLSEPSQRQLETFVREGGGLCVFLGPQADWDFYRDWARPTDGSAFFPVEPQRVVTLPRQSRQGIRVVAENHPVFRVLRGEGQIFASALSLGTVVRVPPEWEPPVDAGTRVLAVDADGSPLVVERTVGDGRLLVFLTTLAPDWNNWARQPTFPVMLLECQAFLDRDPPAQQSAQPGSHWTLPLATEAFLPSVQVVLPTAEGKSARVVRTAMPTPADPGRRTWNFPAPGRSDTDEAGIYTAWAQSVDGQWSAFRRAYTVEPLEGRTALTPPPALAEALSATGADIYDFDAPEVGGRDDGGLGWSRWLMGVLVVLLMGEQLLAYSASYHPRVGSTP